MLLPPRTPTPRSPSPVSPAPLTDDDGASWHGPSSARMARAIRRTALVAIAGSVTVAVFAVAVVALFYASSRQYHGRKAAGRAAIVHT